MTVLAPGRSRQLTRLALAIVASLAAVAASARAATAGPALVFEPATGRVLHAEDIDHAWFPASLTKVMTAYVTFVAVKAGRIAWDAPIKLSDYARGQPATRINLRVGIDPTVEQAVHGLILRSANDLAVALAEAVAGSEEAFVAEMNETARRLGMTRTAFRNPHGLPNEEQVSTARDMGLLARAILADFPERAGVFSAPSVLIHKGTFHNQNDLLTTLPGADGMKTGFTCGAGYNIVATATRNGRKLIAVVLGEPNRNDRSRRASELMDAGFAEIERQGGQAPLLLAAMPINTDAATLASDASRRMRMRKCARPDPPAKEAAPQVAAPVATDQPRLAIPPPAPKPPLKAAAKVAPAQIAPKGSEPGSARTTVVRKAPPKPTGLVTAPTAAPTAPKPPAKAAARPPAKASTAE